MIIQSLINPKIKHLVALHKPAARKEHQQFIAQGVTTYKTLLEAGLNLHSVYVTAKIYDENYAIIKPEKMVEVTDLVMAKISTTSTPTGLVALFDIPKSKEVTSSNAIVLHNIQDPGNLGTLMRTAAAMNIESVVTMQGVDPYHPKVVQSTAGTIGFINIVQTNWPLFLKHHKQFGLCAMVVDGGQSEEKINLKNTILVLGNEGQGLPPEIVQACDQKLTIAMPGRTESLNVAVVGSIAMYLKSKN